jgi:hypothetical protein
VERGPLVYCFEQADQSARLDELAILPGTPLTERTVTLPGIGSTIQIIAPGRHVPPDPAAAGAGWSSRPAPPAPEELLVPDGSPVPEGSSPPPAPDERAVTVTAVPYFQWDNRGPGAMRVWIPAAGPAGPM